jgi:HTH-type transcriptional regulator/antitoxin HigA
MEGFPMNTVKKQKSKDHYFDLVKQFPLVPIKNERQYDAAVAFLKKLAVRDEGTLASGESDYLDALTLFVEDYQNKHHEIDAAEMKPLEALKFLMEESATSIADLGRILGNNSLASQVLKGRRELSKANIVAVAKHFHVEPGLFLN